MERCAASVPDWHDAAAYAPLVAADRAILAWEWLRRLPAYRDAAARSFDDGCAWPARGWGLHLFEDPDLAAPCARPVWTAAALDAVLTANLAPAAASGSPDFSRDSHLVTAISEGGSERLLFSDGWRAIRVDLARGNTREGPVDLTFTLAGPPRLAAPLLSLRRLESLLRTGGFARALHQPVPRARRELLLLRTADALGAGAQTREIAAVLLHHAAQAPKWREERPELRLQSQRLVRDARARLAGGYRGLLRRSSPQSQRVEHDTR